MHACLVLFSCAGPSCPHKAERHDFRRYRRLEAAVRSSLADLERALQGLAPMSTDLEQMSISLSSDQVLTPTHMQNPPPSQGAVLQVCSPAPARHGPPFHFMHHCRCPGHGGELGTPRNCRWAPGCVILRCA